MTNNTIKLLKAILPLLFVILSLTGAEAQLTGVKTIPTDYATLSLAIADLNVQGVGAGGVTINVPAGYTETLAARLDLTATGTLANPIIIQKNGAGANPLITSYVGSNINTAATMDGMFALIGSDYVTIDGIDLTDAVANTTNITTMEYGYGLFKASGTDGANNNTIKNCVITLNRINNTAATSGPVFQGSIGISLVACTPTNMQVTTTVTSIAGASSNNKFYTNTIQNVNCGICMTGYAGATPFTLCDTGNDIGGSSSGTGNIIRNFGGGAGATNACAAVFVKDQWSFNVSYNTVNNNNGSGVNHPATNRGIFANASSIGASATINNNTVTIQGGTSTTAIDWAIDCEMAQSGAAGNTISINNNTISITKTTATTVALTAIWVQSAPTTMNINGNTITNFTSSSTSTSTTDHGVIRSGLAGIGTLNITNNSISGVSISGATGTVFAIANSGSVTTAVNITGNNINGIDFTVANSRALNVITNTGAANTSAVTISNNNIQGITFTGTGSGTSTMINTTGTPLTATVSGNTFTNLTLKTTGSVTFISHSYSIPAGGTQTISNNSIVTAFNKTSAGGTVTCTTSGASSPNGTTASTINNNFSNITVTGATAIQGVLSNDGSGSSPTKIFTGNTFSNWTGGTSAITCLTYNYLGATTSSISNNTFSGITGQGALTVMNIGNTFAGATPLNVANNTISNITSSGTGGAVIGITCSNTSATININNNEINTLSTTAGSAVSGIVISGATNTNVFANKIYNLSGSAAASTVNGLLISGGTLVNAYNNIIGDLRTPAANLANPIAGINISGGTTANVYYNTVYLNATSAGALFGTACLYAATTPTVTSRNNIFVNTSTSNGALGFTTAFRRTGLSTSSNLTAASNQNIFYAGTPSANNLIYYDGTNSDQQLGAYKVRMNTLNSGMELFSATENVSFISTTGSNANFLHVNTGTTWVESAGAAVSGITTDFDATTRNATTPDIGADEISGTMQTIAAPITFASNSNTTTSFNITWVDNSTNESGFAIYRSLNATGPFTLVGFVSSTTIAATGGAYSLAQTGLLGNTTYYYEVYANGGFNSSALTGSATTTACSSGLTGTYSVGPTGTYANLGAAITAMNTSGLSGSTILELQATYTSSGETFPLTISNTIGCLSSTGNTLTIRPETGATALLITSANATTTIDINGANGVIIDGRPGGSGTAKQLTIQNTLGTAPALRLINEASNNTIKYTDVQSNNSNTAAATAGVILFSTTTGTYGNDNNTIDNCDVHNVTGGNPVVAINSNGTTTTINQFNDNNIVSNSNVFDYFNATNAYSGILINGGNSAWSITNNHFYQTAARTFTSTAFNKDIYLNSLTGNASGSGYVISGNFIGGANSSGTGSYSLSGTTGGQYASIYCAVGVGTATSVQNNTIANIVYASGSTSAASMSGIYSNGGNVNIGTITGNTIGAASMDASVSPSISFTNNNTTTGGFIPIYAAVVNNPALSTTNISNNTIAGIAVASTTATNAAEFHGIGYNSGTISITNNTIGSTSTPKSIYYSSTSSTSTANSRIDGILISGATSSIGVTVTGNTIANIYSNFASNGAPTNTGLKGINCAGTLTGNTSVLISNNIIRDLTTFAQTTTAAANAALGGIVYGASGNNVVISGNQIYNLTLAGASTTAAIIATGISINSAPTGANLLTKNLVHSIGITAANNSAIMNGIELSAGAWNTSNNMIRLGIDGLGNNVTQGLTIRGISKTATTVHNIYNNSVYVGGTGVINSAFVTAALYRSGAATTDDIRNNIFVNNRSNASTGANHYQAYLNTIATLTLNNNIYFGNGTGSVFGNIASVDVPAYSSAWVASDIASYAGTNPNFINPTGTAATVDLHINATLPAISEQTGAAIAAVTDDYDNQSRASFTPNDCGADAGNFISMLCSGTPPSSTASLTSTTPICGSGSKSMTLTAFSNIPGYTYQWNESATGTAGTFVPVTTGTGGTTINYTTATLTSSMYYNCTVTCTNGGASTNSSNVQVVINPTPVLTISPAAGNVCDGALVNYTVLGAGAGATYSWTATNGVAGPVIPNYQLIEGSRFLQVVTARPSLSQITSTTAGTVLGTNYYVPTNPTYTVTATSAAGCPATASVTPTVINPYNFSINNISLTSNVATLATSVAHSINVGDIVNVQGINNTAANNNVFNGIYTVTAVTSNTFSYAKTNPNIAGVAVSTGNVIGLYLPHNFLTSTSPTSVCATGTPVSITATNNAILGSGNSWTYNWYDITGATLLQTTTSTSATDTYTPPTPSSNGSYNYLVTVSNSICPSSISMATPKFDVGFTATTVVTDANCGNNGSVTITATGQDNFTTWYNNNFATGLLGGGADDAFTNPTVTTMFQDGTCVLHQNITSQNGAFIVKNPASINTNNLQLDFDLTTGPRSSGFNIYGGSGFAWSYAPDVPLSVLAPGTTGTNPENGSGSGVKLAFDATPNGAINVNGAYLMYNCNTADQGPLTSGVLAYYPGGFWQGLYNAHVKIKITDAGLITVSVNNVIIFNNIQLPAAYLTANKSTWIHGFTDRSGGASENTGFDNLMIRYTSGYEYSVTSTTGLDGTWQATNTFSGLAAGTYPVWVRDPANPSTCFSNTGSVTIATVASPTSASVIATTGFSTVLCPGSSTSLTTSVPVAGATFAWESSPTGAAGTWSPAYGANTIANYITSALNADTFYRVTFTCPSSSPVIASPLMVDVNQGVISATNSPQMISCLGSSATLTATPGTNTSCVWYAAATGGSPLTSGNSYSVTPSSFPTTYYVEPVTTLYSNNYFGGGQSVISNAFGTSSTSSTGAYPTRFTTDQSIIINNIRVQPTTAGVLTITLNSGTTTTVLSSFSTTITAGQLNTMVTIPVNFNVPGAGTYQIVTSGVSCACYSTYSGSYSASYMKLGIPTGNPTTFIVTGSATSVTGTLSTTTYGTSFNIDISSACATLPGSRIPVIVNANPTSAITITPTPNSTTLCTGQITTLAASSSTAYTSYIWSPTTDLFTDAAATIAYTGTNATTVYYKPATAGTKSYSVAGTNVGCNMSSTINFTVNQSPIFSTVATATPNAVCIGGSSTLSSLAVMPSSASSYSFIASSGTFTPLTGATVVTGMNADNFTSAALPIGFNFNFAGTNYTTLKANSNGYISFNPSVTGLNGNNLASSVATTYPLLAPLWDDIDGAGSGGVGSYLTSGTPGNQVFTFEWLNWEWNWLASANVISFQVKLYEIDNHIEFIYNQGPSAYNAGTTGGASIGIASASGNYLSLTDSGTSPGTSSTTETTNIAVKPASGQIYSFSPPVSTISYTWTESPVNSTLATNNTASVTASNITTTETYTVSASNGTCASTSNVTVTAAPLASAPTATSAPSLGTYNFQASSSTYSSIVGTSGAVSVPGIVGDQLISGAIPIGFNFIFAGNSYTNVYASSNGFLSLNSAATNNSGNNLTSGTATTFPLLAPLWDDLDATAAGAYTGGTATYVTTGSVGNRVFTFEWKDWEYFWTASVATISFQCKVYEVDNHIEFIYDPITASPINSPAASIGIATAPGTFWSLNNTSTSPTASKTTETATINTSPVSGQKYSFTVPTTPCPGSLYSISANATGGGAPYTYAWTATTASGTTSLATTSASFTANPLETTTYNVTVTDNCVGSTPVVQSVTALVQVNPLTITPSVSNICGQVPVTLTATGSSTTYTWSPNFGLNTATGASVIATPTPQVYIPLTVTGFNNDIVASGVGTSTLAGTTYPTIGVDGANYFFIDNTFKYNASSALPSCYMPPNNQASSSLTSGLIYNLQSYTSNNALSIISTPTAAFGSPIPTTGALTLSTPASYQKLYVLYESVVNTGTPSITATVTFTDASTQVFSGNTVVNWFTATNPAVSNVGRTSPSGNIECGVQPNLFELGLTINPANYTKLVQSISFNFAAAAGTTNSTVNYFHAMSVVGTPITAVPPATFTYTVTGTFGACTGTSSAVINYTAPPALTNVTATPATVCAGDPSTVNVTSAHPNYTYTWTPTSLVGASQSVTPAPTTTTQTVVTYTVNAVDNTTGQPYSGCVSTGTVGITVNPLPAAITVTPSPATMLIGTPASLSATGGTILANNVTDFVNGTQANQNTAGSGTLTDYPAPYSIYYGGQRMQMLVLASELTSNGYIAGPITAIKFPVVSKGANWGSIITSCQNFQVKIGHTVASTLTSFQTGLTQVIAPSNFTPNVGYTNTHTFATPFNWDGTSNIILETTFSNAILGAAADAVIQYNTPTTFASTVVYRVDNTAATTVANATAITYSYNARPDFKLTATSQAPVANPYTWTPNTTLFLNNTASTAYTGNPTSVFANPAITSTYTVRSTNATTGCFNETPVTVVIDTPPTNYDCAHAIALSLNTYCAPIAGTSKYGWYNPTAIPTTPAVTTTTTCSGDADDDVWYSIYKPAGYTQMTFKVVGSSNYDAAFEILGGSCTALTSLDCKNSLSTTVNSAELSTVTFPAQAATYYVRVYDARTGYGSGDFDICVYANPPVPVNNDPCSPVNLSANQGFVASCATCLTAYDNGNAWTNGITIQTPNATPPVGNNLVYYTGSTTFAGEFTGEPVPTGATSPLKSVWLNFRAPLIGGTSVVLRTGYTATNFATVISVYALAGPLTCAPALTLVGTSTTGTLNLTPAQLLTYGGQYLYVQLCGQGTAFGNYMFSIQGVAPAISLTGATPTSLIVNIPSIVNCSVKYIKYRTVGSGGFNSVTLPGTATSYTMTNLASGTNYEVWCGYSNSIGQVFYSNVVTLGTTIGCTIAPPAATITPIAGHCSQAVATWPVYPNLVAGYAYPYRFYQQVAGSGGYNVTACTTNSKTLSGLALNTNYNMWYSVICTGYVLTTAPITPYMTCAGPAKESNPNTNSTTISGIHGNVEFNEVDIREVALATDNTPADGNEHTVTIGEVVAPAIPAESTSVIVKEGSFELIPNPATNNVTVNYVLPSASNTVSIQLLDIQGKVVKTITNPSQDVYGLIEIDLSNVNAGVYLVSVRADGFNATKKLVVNK